MKAPPTRVLITDGDYKHALGAVRSLAQAGFQVDAIGSRDCLCRWSRWLSQIAYPQARFSEDHVGEFISFLADSHYDVLLPIGARSVQLVSRYRQAIEKHCGVPLPSPRAVETCLNKEATYRFATEVGVKIPRTWAFTCIQEVEAHMSEFAFPVVVKGRSEIAKDRPSYAQTPIQLLEVLAAWGQGMDDQAAPFPLIQQYTDGTGVGFFALYQHGHCKRVFMHRRMRETPPSGGASCCALSIYESDLLAAGKKLLDALSWHGVAMVEFKRGISTAALYLMEVNPKFWGSLDLALACGVDFPALDVRMALGEDIPYSQDYTVGLKFHWPLDGEISHIRERPRATFSVLLDCIDPRTKSNLHADDPLPALYSLYMEFRRFRGWLFKRSGLPTMLHRVRTQGLRRAILRTFSEATGIPLIRYGQVTPQIIVGGQHSAAGKRKLRRVGISGTVNMRSEFDDSRHDLVLGAYCHLPTAEFAAPTIEHLHEGVAFIQSVTAKGGKVYIHCSEGVSRAPALAAAYLLSQGVELRQAVALIKRSRPFVDILPVQMERLREFASLEQKGDE